MRENWIPIKMIKLTRCRYKKYFLFFIAFENFIIGLINKYPFFFGNELNFRTKFLKAFFLSISFFIHASKSGTKFLFGNRRVSEKSKLRAIPSFFQIGTNCCRIWSIKHSTNMHLNMKQIHLSAKASTDLKLIFVCSGTCSKYKKNDVAKQENLYEYFLPSLFGTSRSFKIQKEAARKKNANINFG